MSRMIFYHISIFQKNLQIERLLAPVWIYTLDRSRPWNRLTVADIYRIQDPGTNSLQDIVQAVWLSLLKKWNYIEFLIIMIRIFSKRDFCVY